MELAFKEAGFGESEGWEEAADMPEVEGHIKLVAIKGQGLKLLGSKLGKVRPERA